MSGITEENKLSILFTRAGRYKKEISSINQLTEEEGKELLDIVIHLKKNVFYNKKFLEELVKEIDNIEIQNKIYQHLHK